MVLDVPGDDTETTYPCQAFEKGFMYEKDGQIVINTEYVYEDGSFKMVDPPTMEESLSPPSYFGSRLDEAAVEGTDGYTYYNYTYGVAKGEGAKSPAAIAGEKGCPILGEFSCRGYDTFGPLRLVGGIAKGRPDTGELESARSFFRGLKKRLEQGNTP